MIKIYVTTYMIIIKIHRGGNCSVHCLESEPVAGFRTLEVVNPRSVVRMFDRCAECRGYDSGTPLFMFLVFVNN